CVPQGPGKEVPQMRAALDFGQAGQSAENELSHDPVSALSGKRGRDVPDEALELLDLVDAGEAYAQVGHACSFVALQCFDDRCRRSQPDQPAVVDATAVVLL